MTDYNEIALYQILYDDDVLKSTKSRIIQSETVENLKTDCNFQLNQRSPKITRAFRIFNKRKTMDFRDFESMENSKKFTSNELL